MDFCKWIFYKVGIIWYIEKGKLILWNLKIFLEKFFSGYIKGKILNSNIWLVYGNCYDIHLLEMMKMIKRRFKDLLFYF